MITVLEFLVDVDVKNLEELQCYQYGNSKYISDEYTLTYKTNYYINHCFDSSVDSFLLIQDMLTIVFDLNSNNFISFDDYTNKDLWEIQENLMIPNVYSKGVLKIKKGFKGSIEDDNRCYFKEEIQYFYSKRNGILKIALTEDEENAIFYEISSNLIVGMHNKRIVSIYLNKINFI